jgi:hypothetical protein
MPHTFVPHLAGPFLIPGPSSWIFGPSLPGPKKVLPRTRSKVPVPHPMILTYDFHPPRPWASMTGITGGSIFSVPVYRASLPRGAQPTWTDLVIRARPLSRGSMECPTKTLKKYELGPFPHGSPYIGCMGGKVQLSAFPGF